MDLWIEKFKHINAYLLHMKYPERNAEDNWFHSCEILNLIFEGKTYLISKNYKITAHSTPQWYKNFQVEIRHTNLVVYYHFKEKEITIGSFPLPLELPNEHEIQKEFIVHVDALSIKKLIIEKKIKTNI